MATLISTLYSRIAPRVKSCPEPTIQQAVLDAAIEFCADTRIYFGYTQLAVTASVTDYTLPAPSDADEEIHTVMRVWHKDRPLSSTNDTLIDRPEVLFSTSFGTRETGDPRRFLKVQNGAFSVYPVPNTTIADGFTVQYAMKPKLTATTVPDLLVDQWRDAIISGALSRLRSMPGQAWSGDASSDYAFFRYYKGKAKMVAMQGQNAAPVRVHTRGFGR